MATKKTKKTNKRFLKRVHALTEKDIFKSLAIASILFNVLFLISILVFTNTNTFDRKFYKTARSHYCKNITAVQSRAAKLGSEEKAVQEWQVDCIGSEFEPFYKEALEKYRAHQN